jgi:signal peptidase I
MAKRKQAAKKHEPTSATPQVPRKDNLRETIESIVIALVLAFLFQAFDAQAFEIPTGSMGPTLMGRHKDVVCAECGFRYQAGASIEVNDLSGQYREHNRVLETTCPLCRYPTPADSNNNGKDDQISYKGDRIWVSKAPYILGNPKRFDVAVFKYPNEAHENYIKRIVGLPGETVRISQGDLFSRPAREDEFTIARKPPHKVLPMSHPVFDSDYLPRRLLDAGWPPRWQVEPRADGSSGGDWTTADGTASFETDGTAAGEVWIRYHHIIPNWEDWEALDQGPFGSNYSFPPPQLIADFCGYNSGVPGDRASPPVPEPIGHHWVGDLTVACELEVASNRGEVTLELVEGGRRFRCRLNLASGQARLSIDGVESYQPTAQTTIRGIGQHEIVFANVDDQLHVWVDGNVVEFDQPTTYEPLGNRRPTVADLAPVGIAARDANVRVSRLRIYRDIYYIAGRRWPVRDRRGSILTDFDNNPWLKPSFDQQRTARFLSSPEMWAAFDQIEPEDYRIDVGEYFVLGDNSPNSSDGRLWNGQRLPSELLIGKAFFIYWPHAWETHPSFELSLGNRKLHLPFYPNFGRMRRIR